MPVLWDQYGLVMIGGYCFTFLFLTFGLFNLITATIVESTMEAGKQDDAKRRRQLKKEHLQVAYTVKELVRALITEEQHEDNSGRNSRGSWFAKQPERQQLNLHARISSKKFLSMLDNPKIRDLLDEIGIMTTDPHNYIDAFDANEEGMLSTRELVQGLLKLRGNVEK